MILRATQLTSDPSQFRLPLPLDLKFKLSLEVSKSLMPRLELELLPKLDQRLE